MTIDEGNVSLFDPFTHTKLDEIMNFDFWSESQNKGNREKVKIDETFCTLITVGEKFLEEKKFQKVMMKIDEIRCTIRIKDILKISEFRKSSIQINLFKRY